jgi:hypothetical protein
MVATRRTKARVDPELRRQLQTSAAGAAPVQAVMRLRARDGASLVPPPELTRGIADEVVSRVADELGVDVKGYDVNVFPNLGYFVLSAPSRFVERVLAQPEIASASANRRS